MYSFQCRLGVSPKTMTVLFVLGIIQYWAIGSLFVYGRLSDSCDLAHLVLAFVTYFVLWSSAGGLIGLAVSRRRVRGGLFGAMIGPILAAVLMT
jgi:hypothetical protein